MSSEDNLQELALFSYCRSQDGTQMAGGPSPAESSRWRFYFCFPGTVVTLEGQELEAPLPQSLENHHNVVPTDSK